MFSEDVWTAVIGKPDPRLLAWLNDLGLAPIHFSDPHEGMIAKNRAIRAFLETGWPFLLMIDGDQIPTPETRILTQWDEPLAYCGYPSRTIPLRGHFGPGDFGAGCLRVAREVLIDMERQLDPLNRALSNISIPVPGSLEIGWFFRPINGLGTREFRCPCQWFQALARSAGYEAVMLGTIGHAVSSTEVLFLDERFIPFSTQEPQAIPA